MSERLRRRAEISGGRGRRLALVIFAFSVSWGLARIRYAAAALAAASAILPVELLAQTKPSGDAGYAIVGNPQGDVTLVEFFDYNCMPCRQELPLLRALIADDPELKVVLRDHPILGPDSLAAAKVALAVKQQLTADKFLEYHARLMSSKSRVNRTVALDAAREMGLKPSKISQEAEKPAILEGIMQTSRIASGLLVSGTPTFILGGEIAFRDLKTIQREIELVRRCGLDREC